MSATAMRRGNRWHAVGRGLALALLLAVCLPARPSRGYAARAIVSYYTQSGPMYVTGAWTFAGAAACSSWLWGRWVYIVEADVTLYCADWGDPAYFEAQTAVDVYSPDGRPWWMTQTFFTVEVI